MRARFNRIPNLGALLKGHFFTGLLVLIPIGVIAWILASALSLLWRLHLLFPPSMRPENLIEDRRLALLINFALTLGVALLLALFVSILGWASKLYLGKKALDILAHIIQRIPVVRSIYSALDQLLKTLAASGGQQFNRDVPTTPNPTSGFHLIVPEKDVRDSHMKVEEAFKVILSLGIAQPDSVSQT